MFNLQTHESKLNANNLYSPCDQDLTSKRHKSCKEKHYFIDLKHSIGWRHHFGYEKDISEYLYLIHTKPSFVSL